MQGTQVKSAPKPSAEPPSPDCVIEQRGDGLIVHIRLDAQASARLRRKAYTQDLATHLWQNVLKPAISGYLW